MKYHIERIYRNSSSPSSSTLIIARSALFINICYLKLIIYLHTTTDDKLPVYITEL
jgi:hypothetical protein